MSAKVSFNTDETPFERWWRTEGGHMSPYVSETIEETRRRISHIAWLNGEYYGELNAQTSKTDGSDILANDRHES